MNNTQLETFVRVVEAGSFNKASEEMFITSTAVIKQVNQLETELGAPLFERTHRGLTLTPAGNSLYKDSKYIIEYMRETVLRARRAMSESENVIRIGTSPMTPAQILTDLWPRIHEHCPDIHFQLIPFENTPENAREILANLGRNIDIVTGIFDDTFLDLRKCEGFEIAREPLCCAMSINHLLANKDKLTMRDMYGENLMLIHRDWSRYIDALRDDIFLNHSQINVIDFDFYDIGVFNTCERNKDLLVVIRDWDCIHPMMKVVPVEWEYNIPFGVLYSPKPSEIVERFLSAVKTVIQGQL